MLPSQQNKIYNIRKPNILVCDLGEGVHGIPDREVKKNLTAHHCQKEQSVLAVKKVIKKINEKPSQRWIKPRK